jgi:hypothetical protein
VDEAWVDDLAQETLLLAYRPPLFAAFRSGHRLLQRQPPQKQIPCSQSTGFLLNPPQIIFPLFMKASASMKKQLREFQQQTADPWILKWEYE